jgi:hypothetical protein
MKVYLLNTQRLNHVDLYGPKAFFDLDLEGRQATMLLQIEKGQHCIVAGYASRDTGPDSIVVFSTFRLEIVDPCLTGKHGKTCRVFFGACVSQRKCVKQEAAKDPAFAACFNKNGHFLRRSVIQC